ncbi:MAG: hypothetical protein CTY39_01400 [Hyphomicrobium sp.]|nr:MAG: hypothetical protein CTY39_01400 [Hyphomicrobium sp.]
MPEGMESLRMVNWVLRAFVPAQCQDMGKCAPFVVSIVHAKIHARSKGRTILSHAKKKSFDMSFQHLILLWYAEIRLDKGNKVCRNLPDTSTVSGKPKLSLDL